jgi:hypothetical protein
MNLGLILSVLYPNAAQGDYSVQDDGQGPYIKSWDEAKIGPQPDEGALLAAEAGAMAKHAAKRKIAELEASVTLRRMREAVRGSGKAWLDSVDDQISLEREKLNRPV